MYAATHLVLQEPFRNLLLLVTVLSFFFLHGYQELVADRLTIGMLLVEISTVLEYSNKGYSTKSRIEPFEMSMPFWKCTRL